MRLIDLDALGIGKCNPDVFDDKGYAKGWNSAIEILKNAPTVDAVPVVRCRECKWFAEGKWCRNPNNDMVQGGTTSEWFCGDGERKGGADDGKSD